MATDTLCPYCKRLTFMNFVGGSARLVDYDDAVRVEAAFQCAACDRMIIGGAQRLGIMQGDGRPVGPTVHKWSEEPEIADALIGRVQYWEPVAPAGKTYQNLPEEIASPASEAYQCLSIGANRSAVLMARAVLEATAKQKGVTAGGIAAKIDKLVEGGHVRKLIADAAHAVRLIANEMAHGDFATATVTREDAADYLALMDEVLNEAFAIENRLSALLARRAAKVPSNT